MGERAAALGATLRIDSANGSGTTVQWATVVDKVVIPMILSPIVAFSLGFLLMLAIMWLFRRQKTKTRKAR